MSSWVNGRGDLADVVEAQTATCLKVYREDPSRILEDANNEARIASGGYSTRQLEELVQNAVDAARSAGQRIEVLLRRDRLYAANDGAPFDADGVRALMASDISAKGESEVGRFGIGFKSVLAVSDEPRIYSRSVSFGFDRSHAARMLRGAGLESHRFPTMRTAVVLDAQAASRLDPDLAELMEWASTVVVLPLRDPEAHRLLSARLDLFRDEFLLFSPHITRAALRNEDQLRPTNPRSFQGLGLTADEERRLIPRQFERFSYPDPIRELSVADQGGGAWRLTVNGISVDWAVARASHTPSVKALADGSYSAGREHIEVAYAVCLSDDRFSVGEFWSYFPTSDATTLSGIVNAPWKLSDDRKHLLRGAFNEELLTQVLPHLISRAFRAFQGTDRIAAVLDAMPARGDEPRSDADDIINKPVIGHLQREPSLPDGTGRLRCAAELKWLGSGTLGKGKPVTIAWHERWRESGGHLDDWIHPLAYSTSERRAKAGRLIAFPRDADAVPPAGLDVWLEDLVREGTVEESARAIALAAWVLDQSKAVDDLAAAREIVEAVQRARIIRLESGDLKAATRGRVFVKVEGEDRPGVDFVEPELVNLPGVKEGLARLGVVLMDRTGRLHELLALAQQPDTMREPARVWPQIWEILREIPLETALSILGEDLRCADRRDLTLRVRLRTATGKWVSPGMAFLAGDIVPADGSRDREFLVDPLFHRADTDLLREVGAVEAPSQHHELISQEAWFGDYVNEMKDHFIKGQTGSKPDPTYVLVGGGVPLWPMQILTAMSPQARAAATARILAQGLPGAWSVRHRSNASYGEKRVISPEAWFIRKHGLLVTRSFGLMRPKNVVVAGDGIPADVLPAFECDERVAKFLKLKKSPSEITDDDWATLKAVADHWTNGDGDDNRRAAFYAWTADSIQPDTIIVRVGHRRLPVEPKNVGVTDDDNVYAAMLEAQIPALRVADDEDVAVFVDNWATPLGKDLLQEEVLVEVAGEPEYLTDLYPPLKLRLAPEDRELRLQPCTRLERMIATPNGQKALSIAARREGDTVLVTASTREERLRQVSDVLDLGMTREDIARVFDQMNEAAANQLRVKIKRAADDDDRLLIAVGVDALRRVVPAHALEVLEKRPQETRPREVSALARAVHGVGILKQLRTALEEANLEPPREWTGRRAARQWVRQLGFPAEWAGFPTAGRPAVELVDGPVTLGGLHDYQEHVTRNIAAMLRGVGSDRGMVSLPTGAGKTRVTVEALVNEINAGTIDTERPLVWIAQTDELCEQAAETWTYVWRAIGRATPMRLGRLWASNEVPEETGTFQLVVATIDKLDAIVKRGSTDYDWLPDASVVVIDEAHTSIASSYTKVLDWMGRGSRGRDPKSPKPLIGLTATPFRGTSTEQTERLVNRYDGNRLDRGAFRNADDPYGELQDMGVLARVRHQIVDGVDVHLTDVDVEEIERQRHVPSAVAARLGADLDRTTRIVDAIADLPDDWTILTFAPSVENARVLAALLAHRGIPAVSISADTEPAARRHYVQEFKAGRIRVVTNYNVLTQGFDAPEVQAVFVARPTFTPNVYQQMVGRGLRGPRNGGSEEVLIVNVRDNFQKYGELLAFNDFEYLWNR